MMATCLMLELGTWDLELDAETYVELLRDEVDLGLHLYLARFVTN